MNDTARQSFIQVRTSPNNRKVITEENIACLYYEVKLHPRTLMNACGNMCSQGSCPLNTHICTY